MDPQPLSVEVSQLETILTTTFQDKSSLVTMSMVGEELEGSPVITTTQEDSHLGLSKDVEVSPPVDTQERRKNIVLLILAVATMVFLWCALLTGGTTTLRDGSPDFPGKVLPSRFQIQAIARVVSDLFLSARLEG